MEIKTEQKQDLKKYCGYKFTECPSYGQIIVFDFLRDCYGRHNKVMKYDLEHGSCLNPLTGKVDDMLKITMELINE